MVAYNATLPLTGSCVSCNSPVVPARTDSMTPEAITLLAVAIFGLGLACYHYGAPR